MNQKNSADAGLAASIPMPRIVELHEHYRRAMFDDVMPWWMSHSLDREYGGYYGHLGRDGTPYSTDKYMWTTGRQIWMLSHLYNTHEQRPEWLEAARLGADYLLEHGFRDNGKMHFRLTRQGVSRSEALSTYTEVFGSIALAEYSKATGDDRLWDRAVSMYDFLVPRLGQPDNTPMLAYPIDTEIHLHAQDMCRITVAWVFNEIHPDDRFLADLQMSADAIVGLHWKPEGLPSSSGGVLLENVAMDGSPMLDIAECRMFHPGHAIESAWMMMEVALKQDNRKLFDTSVDIMLAALEHGWDEKYGGIRYLTNYDWTPTHDLGADLKLWWPHSEALYALLLAWIHTGREDIGRWYENVHKYSFDNFPDPEYGEWYGYLNRDGSPVWTAKANGWKGCFHLPRVLYRCYRLLDSSVKSNT
ncbi:MAG: AGE family epimerase/isomerase [Pirellulales bacterium]|nr:AGE family epimerase/isomerase [Pirellulales bacterium]